MNFLFVFKLMWVASPWDFKNLKVIFPLNYSYLSFSCIFSVKLIFSAFFCENIPVLFCIDAHVNFLMELFIVEIIISCSFLLIEHFSDSCFQWSRSMENFRGPNQSHWFCSNGGSHAVFIRHWSFIQDYESQNLQEHSSY